MYDNNDKIIICQLVQKYPRVADYFTPGTILKYSELKETYPNVLNFPAAFRLHEKFEPIEAPIIDENTTILDKPKKIIKTKN